MADSSVPDYLVNAAARPHWERIGVRRRFGLCVPLFSLRSERGCGVGDAADLADLCPWLAAAGIDVVQLLPINDAGIDGMPYSALSAFALDPIYIALDRIPGIREHRDFLDAVGRVGAELNAASYVDYPRVRRTKTALLEQALGLLDGPELGGALAAFQQANPWLDDYLAFRVIKEVEGFASWESWRDRWRGNDALAQVQARHPDRVRLHLFAQWVLDGQFQAARVEAERHGLLIEGDIPILVARDSADVWRRPDLFRLDVSAGAPPDMYAQDGQNWGFPTYNWPAHQAEGDAWWRARLRHAQRFYHLYRIDHVVGFFRIWTIPSGERTGRNGWFEPWNEAVWGDHGRRVLRMMLDASRMLPLAEDLGTIPDICRQTLAELGICGFKVQRWEKRWHGDRRFIPPGDYLPLSMATLSTHDSEILAQWWAENPDERRELAALIGFDGEPPAVLGPELHRHILRWIRGAGSLFVVLMLQELLGAHGRLPGDPASHRINLPGQVLPTNWTWRSPLTIRELIQDTDMTASIRDISREQGGAHGPFGSDGL